MCSSAKVRESHTLRTLLHMRQGGKAGSDKTLMTLSSRLLREYDGQQCMNGPYVFSTTLVMMHVRYDQAR